MRRPRRKKVDLKKTRPGPQPQTPSRLFSRVFCAAKDDDIVDEAIRLFRANVMFRNFEVQGGGDRLLVYMILFIHQVRQRGREREKGERGARRLPLLTVTDHISLLCRPAFSSIPPHLQCLKKIEKKANKADALRELTTLAQGSHYIPGDGGWPLGQLMPAPKTSAEQEALRLYFRQIREGLVPRLVDRVFNEDGTPNKHWMQYSKKKFMNKEFP